MITSSRLSGGSTQHYRRQSSFSKIEKWLHECTRWNSRKKMHSKKYRKNTSALDSIMNSLLFIQVSLMRLLLLSIIFLSFFSSSLKADTVILRSGTTYTNVITEPFSGSHKIQFSNGSILILSNSKIRSLRPGPIKWGQSLPTVKKLEPQPMESPSPHPAPPVVLPEEQEEPEIGLLQPKGYRWGPLLKSSILPGWGQYSEGRKWSGFLFAASSMIALQKYWTLRQKHAAAESDYNDPIPVGLVSAQAWTGSISIMEAAAINLTYLSQKESLVNRLQKQGNTMVGVLTIIWGWSIFDIVSGSFTLTHKNSTVSFALSLIFQLQNDSMTVGIRTYL